MRIRSPRKIDVGELALELLEDEFPSLSGELGERMAG
jgi:hypothetical protein